MIEQHLKALKLGGLSKDWKTVKYLNNEQYLTVLLELELKEREVNRINRMVKSAGFRVMKTLENFVWTNNILLPGGITAQEIEEYSFVDKKENLILMGSVGTGKTHW